MALVLTNDVPRRWVEAPDGGGVTDHGLLSGLADDDHPQYATDTDLAGKRDVATGTNQVYIRDGSGNETIRGFTVGASANTIVVRSPTGTVDVATPTADAHATPRLFVNDGLATKETSGAASAAITTHVGATDPHTQYHNDARGDGRYSVLTHRHPGSVITAANPMIHLGHTIGFQSTAGANGAYVDLGGGASGARTAQENTDTALFAVDNTVVGAPGIKALAVMRVRLTLHAYISGGSAVYGRIQVFKNTTALPPTAGTGHIDLGMWKGDSNDYGAYAVSYPFMTAVNDVFRIHALFPNSVWGSSGYNGMWLELERLGDTA